MHIKALFLVVSILLFSCKNESTKPVIEIHEGSFLNLDYAKGFSVEDLGTYKILTIHSPWPESKTTYRYALVDKGMMPKITLLKDEFNAIIPTPIGSIVVTSTTHIPALEFLNVDSTLIGFPNLNFISSKKIRQGIDSGRIKELGQNEALNTELLLEQHPEVVVGFGIDGTNRTYETIKKSGIPIVFNGDWTEQSPLAKAEWIKFFGALFNKEKKADSIFNSIEKNYLKAKQIALKAKSKPTLLSGAMHSDIWYLPNGTSTEAQLFKDANVKYLWDDTKGTGSLKLNFESVFIKANNADIWVNPSNYTSLENLKHANEHHALFKPFQEKNIYTFTNTVGASGGILYYELGMTRPDLVLKDLIKICHPELLKNHELYFFKKLE